MSGGRDSGATRALADVLQLLLALCVGASLVLAFDGTYLPLAAAGGGLGLVALAAVLDEGRTRGKWRVRA